MKSTRSLLGATGIAIMLGSGLTVSPALAQTANVAAVDETASVNELMDRTIGLVQAGRMAEAELVARQAVAAAERTLGDDHPYTGIVLAELAGILHRLERLDEAEPLYRRILAIFETAAPGDEHGLATALNNLAEAMLRLAMAYCTWRGVRLNDELRAEIVEFLGRGQVIYIRER